MDIFYDISERIQIDPAIQKAERASDKADHLGKELSRLERRMEALALTTQALWELLRERSDITDEMVIERASEIDLRDGIQDGKMTYKTVICPGCGRPGTNRRTQCLYCNTTLPVEHLFQRT